MSNKGTIRTSILNGTAVYELIPDRRPPSIAKYIRAEELRGVMQKVAANQNRVGQKHKAA